MQSAQGCKYVDEVLYDDVPLAITAEFLDKQYVSTLTIIYILKIIVMLTKSSQIDIVAHGDDFDQEKMRKYYGYESIVRKSYIQCCHGQRHL